MFIYSIRASTVKFAAVLFLGVALVTALVIILPAADAGLPAAQTSADYGRIETVGDMVAFLSKYGLTAEKQPFSDKEVVLPEHFDGIFAEYNELQKKQGLDLSPYAGKTLRQTVFRVKNADGKEYLATLYVCRNCIVGGDIAEPDPCGAVYGFDGKTARDGG